MVAITRLSDDWPDFMDKLNRHYPQFGETIMLPFPDSETDDEEGV